MPCVIGYAEAHHLYDDYKAEGFEVVGITSFQGMYRDKDAGVTEGTKEKPLDKKREIRAHGDVHQETRDNLAVRVLGPLGLRSIPRYGINSIPTFVLLSTARELSDTSNSGDRTGEAEKGALSRN